MPHKQCSYHTLYSVTIIAHFIAKQQKLFSIFASKYLYTMFSDGFAETWLYTCLFRINRVVFCLERGDLFEKINITQLGALADFFVITNGLFFVQELKIQSAIVTASC